MLARKKEREEGDREEEGYSSGEGYESSGDDWKPVEGEREESSTDGEADEGRRKLVDRGGSQKEAGVHG